ncbi:YbaB/EbfC family nucleoid-associated protein [Actinokineospora soli]|uniref:YbaB/EbfC family nucleoid-associated protein n=1 Tax=Actinokineospora soli TaxID=1048753 RepID=A0ABW2TMU9_9PSEU
MDGTILDPDGAREHLAAWQGRIDKMARDTEAMRAKMQDLKVTATDPNGLAEVSVDSTGSLVDLKLTDRISRVAPDVVARAIMATLGSARNQLADRSREVIEETMGAGSPAARAIADTVERHLRTDAAPEAPRRAPAVEDDEDYDPFPERR